jgi:hypothetical protein
MALGASYDNTTAGLQASIKSGAGRYTFAANRRQLHTLLAEDWLKASQMDERMTR